MKINWDDCLFIIGRHGETAGNQKNIYRSWSNREWAQLDPNGKKEIWAEAAWLEKYGAPVELIICDTLDRVWESAEIFATYLKIPRIVGLRGLHPLNMGDYTGKDKDKFPIDPFVKDTSKVIPGGENLDGFNKREMDTFRGIWDVIEGMPGGRVLVIGHGSNISFLHNHIFNVGEPRTGYEGLVDPGGLVAARTSGLDPLTRVRKKDVRDIRVNSKGSGKRTDSHDEGNG